MIDLHTHTTASDGTLTPTELIAAAAQLSLEAVAITDHDTLAGYEQAVSAARQTGVELVCAVELSTRWRTMKASRSVSVHLLGYFLFEPPNQEFRRWLEQQIESRRIRNQRLVARLQQLGVDVTLEEVTARGGRLTGRPHFARLLVEKGYAATPAEAFHRYLGEGAQAYVPRESVALKEGIRRIREAGGLPVLAHPGRLHCDVEALLVETVPQGLGGLEAYASEHTPEQTPYFLELAQRHELAVTGGSDFHGETKPAVALGAGLGGNLSVPYAVLERLRAVAARL